MPNIKETFTLSWENEGLISYMQVFTVCDLKGLCLRSVSSSHVLRSAEGKQHAVGSAKGGTRSEPYNNAFSSTPAKKFEKQKTLENNSNSKSPLYDQSLTHSSGLESRKRQIIPRD